MEKADEEVYCGCAVRSGTVSTVGRRATLGSIPEELRGDLCLQEKTNGLKISAWRVQAQAGSLSNERMTLDTGRHRAFEVGRRARAKDADALH